MQLHERIRAPLWRVPVGLQLSAVYAVLLVATLTVLGGALYTQLDGFLVQNTADRLHQAATALVRRDPGFPPRPRGPEEATPQASNAANPSPVPGDRAFPPDLQANFLVRGLSAPDVTVALLDPAGAVISSTVAVDAGVRRPLPVLPTGWLGQVPDTASAGSSQPTVQWVLPTTGGGRQLVVAQRIDVTSPAGTAVDHLVLLQAASLDAADAILDRVRLYLILGVLIGAAVGVLAGLGLTRALLQPLDRMTRTAEAIAGGDLTRRLRLPAGRNEVARLGSAFDHMVDRLAATLHAQRRFVADASHELRTPLTSLEGLSEMLLLGADRGDSQAVQRLVRAIYGELGRMGRLVTDLLTLSRLDSAAPLAAVSVDLGKLLDDVAAQVAPVAEARHIRLVVAHDELLLVRGEPDRLKQVVLNLADNALRYTPPAGEVCLAAARDAAAGTARVQVQDSGPGIAPEHFAHIFDRFYRVDESRTRASGNSGLGLAIARGIVEAHGGTIELQSPPGQGACFVVVLPADPAGETCRGPVPALPQHLVTGPPV